MMNQSRTGRPNAASARPAHERIERPRAGNGRLASRWLVARVLALLGLIISAAVGVAVNRIDARQQEASRHAEPLLITSATEDWSMDDGYMWAVPGRLSTDDAQALVRRYSAIDPWVAAMERVAAHGQGVRLALVTDDRLSFTRVRIVLRTTQSDTVTVSNLSVRQLRCGPPIQGTLIAAPPQGEVPVSGIRVDLDHPDAPALLDSGTESTDPPSPYFRNRFITVGKSDPQVIELRAFTSERSCAWELEADASAGDRVVRQPIRLSNGEPFQTTAWAPAYSDAFTWPGDGTYLVHKAGPVTVKGALGSS
jgi:hypothetical protein